MNKSIYILIFVLIPLSLIYGQNTDSISSTKDSLQLFSNSLILPSYKFGKPYKLGPELLSFSLFDNKLPNIYKQHSVNAYKKFKTGRIKYISGFTILLGSFIPFAIISKKLRNDIDNSTGNEKDKKSAQLGMYALGSLGVSLIGGYISFKGIFNMQESISIYNDQMGKNFGIKISKGM